ncbi:ABC transporter permease [uncultured Ilyobacter sp.]|uniref:ABC transporter permease n=1 Tax=uncultured Ilyobacter sp. TaxID=544433 RepID=UPI0029BFEA54|nr:ABC transporter permease [uncultured Ilyobacter sp.]
MKTKIQNAMVPVLAVAIALLVGAGIIAYLGENPLNAYYYLFKGAFVGERAIARTLLEATPMIFTGLSVLFAFKAGMFNIGGQGQVIMGGLAAAAVGAFVQNIGINNLFVVLILSGLAGFAWAAIAGYLKAKLGVHEVISTIMLNYIAMSFEQYALNYPLKEGGIMGPSPQTPPVMIASRLPQLIPSTKEALNVGFILAIIAAIVVWYIFEKTILGYEIKAVGHNPTASENAGINVARITALSLGIAGVLAALGGAERILGGVGQYTYRQGIMASYGFDGIAVALLGKNSPVGAVLAAILFACLRVGGRAMQFNTTIPSQIVIILQSIIILLIAAENMFKFFLERKKVSE